jgi:hypothetical protein
VADRPAERPGEVVARLGLEGLHEPLDKLDPANLASFRAVPDYHALGSSLGCLKELPGLWVGSGFNLIARPHIISPSDPGSYPMFLELNLTTEMIDFRSIGSPIPNRGSVQPDINLFGVHYLQQISDARTGGALHIEPGIWVSVPATSSPSNAASLVRLASIPHGDAVNAQGACRSVAGPPTIGSANTNPFKVVPSPPGSPNEFLQYDLSSPTALRTQPLTGITQAMVDDPNVVLRDAIAGLVITHSEVLDVSTDPSGGVENIPFLVGNADVTSVSSTFWIETVDRPDGGTYMQLQYSQTVLLRFNDLTWPHVSVATLIKTF